MYPVINREEVEYCLQTIRINGNIKVYDTR